MSFERARTIADAVLYEGYLLYPYRASSTKNRWRWQFGVLAPEAWSEQGGGDPYFVQSECLVESEGTFAIEARLRCLRLERRMVERKASGEEFEAVEAIEVDGVRHTTFEEGVEAEFDFAIDQSDRAPSTIMIEVAGERTIEPICGKNGEIVARIVRDRTPLVIRIEKAIEPIASEPRLAKVRVRVANVTPWARIEATRDEALTAGIVGAHVLFHVRDGAFVSVIDPPPFAEAAARTCTNLRTWPVLVGDAGARDTILSAPIILYDYPEIAPESPGDLFDGTEIDEILTLRTLTLTSEEKREARATDPRAAAIVDRVDAMSAGDLARLHGVERSASLKPRTKSIDPETSKLRGSRVRLRPGARRADAQDLFFAGRVATIEDILTDVDGKTYLAVTLEEDPGADLQRSSGRFLYFGPDEIEPMDAAR